MHTLIPVQILKIFLGEAALRGGKPVYELLVDEARQRGMAGASVHRGLMGFGASTLLHTAKILRLAEDLPIIVEIVDTPERIAAFLPVIDSLVEDGSIVLQDGQAIFHLPVRVRDVMTENVSTVALTTPLSEVAALLLRRGVKAVPVMDGSTIQGIITGGDLLARAHMPLRLDIHGYVPTALHPERYLDFQNLTAKDIMSYPVKTLNIKTLLTDALALMGTLAIKRLPVVADDGTLLGIISRTDVLAAIARMSDVAGHLDVLPAGVHASAQKILYADVPTASPDASLTDILAQIVASPLRRVVIVDEEKTILGLIQDWNILQHVVRQNSPGLIGRLIHALTKQQREPIHITGQAKDVMITPVPTVAPETSLAEIIRILVAKNTKRMVVADADNHLLGMIDRDVILQELIREQPTAP